MEYISKDHEMQVFVAFALCFGFSILTTLFGLSSALGAFIAG
jgi:CPA2 family monovalent cation:H+ antiporter-2